jgi:hypothetical protein
MCWKVGKRASGVVIAGKALRILECYCTRTRTAAEVTMKSILGGNGVEKRKTDSTPDDYDFVVLVIRITITRDGVVLI